MNEENKQLLSMIDNINENVLISEMAVAESMINENAKYAELANYVSEEYAVGVIKEGWGYNLRAIGCFITAMITLITFLRPYLIKLSETIKRSINERKLRREAKKQEKEEKKRKKKEAKQSTAVNSDDDSPVEVHMDPDTWRVANKITDDIDVDELNKKCNLLFKNNGPLVTSKDGKTLHYKLKMIDMRDLNEFTQNIMNAIDAANDVVIDIKKSGNVDISEIAKAQDKIAKTSDRLEMYSKTIESDSYDEFIKEFDEHLEKMAEQFKAVADRLDDFSFEEIDKNTQVDKNLSDTVDYFTKTVKQAAETVRKTIGKFVTLSNALNTYESHMEK